MNIKTTIKLCKKRTQYLMFYLNESWGKRQDTHTLWAFAVLWFEGEPFQLQCFSGITPQEVSVSHSLQTSVSRLLYCRVLGPKVGLLLIPHNKKQCQNLEYFYLIWCDKLSLIHPHCSDANNKKKDSRFKNLN